MNQGAASMPRVCGVNGLWMVIMSLVASISSHGVYSGPTVAVLVRGEQRPHTERFRDLGHPLPLS
ncbi:hypothetical protein QFZ97_000857 [Paraburkholderia youngii]